MAPPTTDQTLALTEEDIDAIVSDNNRQDLFTHLQNAGIQFSNRDPTVRLAKKLRKFVCGDDDKPAIDMATIMAKFSEMSAGIMKEVQSGMNEMKEELATSSERLEQRIMKVEKGEATATVTVNEVDPPNPQQPATTRLPALKATKPPELEYDNNLEKFEEWCVKWNTYAKLADLDKYPQERQVSSLQECISVDMQLHIRHNVDTKLDGTKSTEIGRAHV